MLALAGCLAGPAGIAPAVAGPVAAVGGFDHYATASGQTTDGILGAVVLGAAGGDLTLAALRFDDSDAGRGFSYTGGLGLPVAPMVMLRLAGTRFIGDGDLRAWRFKAGPQFTLPGGRTLTVSYAHTRNQLGARSNAGMAEAAIPLVPRLAGRASASIASASQGAAVLQGSLGLGVTVAPHVEISGEAGLLNGEAGATGPGSGGGGLLGGLPLVGGGNNGGSGTTTRSTYGTLSLGVRVTWP
jgi:hypothetical protein